MNCISSVKRQHGQQGRFFIKEIIVIDDSSTDEITIDILENLKKMGDAVVLKNSHRKGSAGARNTGIEHAKGEWIAFLDADDWWSDRSLEIRFAALEQFKESVWVGGDFQDFYGTGENSQHGRFLMNLDRYEFLQTAYRPIARAILLRRSLGVFLDMVPTYTCTTMVKKEILDYHNGFNEQLLRAQDYHLWLRLASKYSFVFVPQVLAYYRHHESCSTKSSSGTLQWRISALIDLLNRDEFLYVEEKIRNILYAAYMDLSFELRKEKNFRAATSAAKEAIRLQPFSKGAWKNLLVSILGY